MTLKSTTFSKMLLSITNIESPIDYMCINCDSKNIAISHRRGGTMIFAMRQPKILTYNDRKIICNILNTFLKNYPDKPILCFDKLKLDEALKAIKITYNTQYIWSLKTLIKNVACIFELPPSSNEITQEYVYKKYYNSKYKDHYHKNMIALNLISGKFLKLMYDKQLQDVMNFETRTESIINSIRLNGIDVDVNYIKQAHTLLTSEITGITSDIAKSIGNAKAINKADILSYLERVYGIVFSAESVLNDELYKLAYKTDGNKKLSDDCRKILFLRQAHHAYDKYISKVIEQLTKKESKAIDIKTTQTIVGIIKSNVTGIDDYVLNDLSGNELIDTKKLIAKSNTLKVCYEYDELELRLILQLCLEHLEKDKIPTILKEIYVDKNESAFDYFKAYSIGDTTGKDDDFINYVVRFVISSFTFGASLYVLYKRRDIYERLGVGVIEKLYQDFLALFGNINELKTFIQTNAEYYGQTVTPYGKKFYFPAEYNSMSQNIPRIYIMSICADVIKEKIQNIYDYLLSNKCKSRIIAIDGYKIYVEIDKDETKLIKVIETLMKKIPVLTTVPVKLNIRQSESIVELNGKERR